MIITEVDDDDDAGEEEGVGDGGEEIGSKKEKKGERLVYDYKGKSNTIFKVPMDQIIAFQLRWCKMSKEERDEERKRVKKEEGRLPQESQTAKESDVTICMAWILNGLTTKEIPENERHKKGDANFIHNFKAAFSTGQIGERVKKVFNNGFLRSHTLDKCLAAFGITDENATLMEDARNTKVKYDKNRRLEQSETMITCRCGNMVCQAPFVEDGARKAPASSMWFNDKNERVKSFPKGEKYIYGKCLRIECACKSKNCQATLDVDGVRRKPATSRFYNDRNERVTSFPEGGVYIYAQCVPATCEAEVCMVERQSGGSRVGNLSTVDAKTINGKPAHKQCVPATCEAEVCMVERQSGGSRVGNLSTVDAKTINGKPAHRRCVSATCEAEVCMVERQSGGSRVGNLSTIRAKTINGKPAHRQCVSATCELGQYCKVIPGGQGTKSDVCVPSLTSPGEYRHRLCSEAKSFDPTNSNVGCAVCGGKYYLSSTSSEVMKYEAEANGLIGFIDNYETITKGKAHMDCWRVIRNDAAKKKEKREKEVLRDRYRNMTAEQWDAERKALIEKAAKLWAK